MLSRKIFAGALLALSLVSLPAAGQISRIEQDFVQWTEIAVDGNPPEGSNGFAEMGNTTDRADFALAVEAFLAESWALADTLASVVDYEVVAFRDTGNGETYYGLIPELDNGDSRGFYFIRPRAGVVRRLVIEAPHAVEDERTGVFASEIFRATGARAVLISGVDRCANLLSPSNCTGSTDCGAHKVSDMAHSVETFFQAFHELASTEHADTVVVQIHGFLADATGEPEFSVSDGSHADDIDPAYLPNLIYREIQEGMEAAVFPALPARNGNSCNLAGHDDFKCGTQNVQARFTNGSSNACTANAPSANGRFIHLEMSNDLRDPVDLADGDPYSQQIVIDALLHIRTTGRIGDRIYADTNGDGNEDPGEPGIHGALIEILDVNDNVVGSTTSAAGNYKVGNLPEGQYRVRVQLPSGYTYGTYLGPDGIGPLFFLPEAQDRTNIDLALNPPALAEIGDFVWEDDGDGFQESNESGVSQSVGVELLTPEGDVAASTTTDPLDGSYALTNVLPGDYVLRVTTPASQGFTQQVTGAAGIDSDIDPATGRSTVFSLASGANDASRDAGLVGPCFDIPLVAKNALWLWKTGELPWPSDWNELTPASLDGWVEDYAPFGFGSGVQFVTTIPNPTGTSGIFATYFRRTFEVDDLSLFRQPLQLTFTRNDGAVVYLNGVEIARRNLPWGAVTSPGMPASTDTTTTETISIPPSLLVSGTNVLAVELHEVTPEPGKTPKGVFEMTLTGKACGCDLAELNLRDSATTYLEEDSKNSNNGSDLTAGVAGEVLDEEVALLRWQTTGLPADAEVLYAEIGLNMTSVSNSSGVRFRVWPLLRSWVESQVTWNNAATGNAWLSPGGAKNAADRDFTNPLGLLALRTQGPGTIPLSSNALPLIEGWVDNPGSNFGLAIGDSGPLGEINFSSDENGTVTNRPTLRVIYRKATCN